MQVELSLSEAVGPRIPEPRAAVTHSGLERWAAAASGATEACLVLDGDGVIVAASSDCCAMLGLGDPVTAPGRQLRDAVFRLIDFGPARGELDEAEADKIPPLLAAKHGRLARGLMRLECPETKAACTMDAIASPLWEGSTLVGSITFLSRV